MTRYSLRLAFFDFPFPAVPRHLPDEALSPELAVELRIHAFAAMIDLKTLTASPAESRFVLLADGNRLAVRMISADSHFRFPNLNYKSLISRAKGLSLKVD